VSAAEAAEGNAEVDWEGLVERAWTCLTPRERAFLLGLQQGRLPEEFQGLSPEALRQLVCRIRRKVRERAAASDSGEEGEKSDFPVTMRRFGDPITVEGPATTGLDCRRGRLLR
jgi:hypothetical protein